MATTCTGVEMFRKILDSGSGWRQRGRACCAASAKEDVERGRCWRSRARSRRIRSSRPQVIHPQKGRRSGRHTPFFNVGYRPQFYFRTTDVTGVAHLPDGTEMVMPGDNIEMTVELITPIAMDREQRFAIREGGRTVGSGVVIEIIE